MIPIDALVIPDDIGNSKIQVWVNGVLRKDYHRDDDRIEFDVPPAAEKRRGMKYALYRFIGRIIKNKFLIDKGYICNIVVLYTHGDTPKIVTYYLTHTNNEVG